MLRTYPSDPPSVAVIGYLAFTRASLYRLTLPLTPPSPNAMQPPQCGNSTEKPSPTGDTEPSSTLQEASASSKGPSTSDAEPQKQGKSWEQDVEDGKESDADLAAKIEKENNGDQSGAPSRRVLRTPSVIFLLHSGQPLSYLSSLISAEGFHPSPSPVSGEPHDAQHSGAAHASESSGIPAGSPRIPFHSGSHPNPGPPPKNRWSPATGLGDFLRSAARAGSFTICINDRRICVRVPSFSSRTRFLRGSLHRKTLEIERLA